jgi:effector-binding domain-containing protein
VGVELTGPLVEQDGVGRSATPAGLVASTTHVGPYGALSAAHRAVRESCETNGHRLAGPNWEIYGHWLPEWNDDPAQIRTGVHYQVEHAP